MDRDTARGMSPREKEPCGWIGASPRRVSVICTLDQPLTALQLAARLGVSPDAAAYSFWELSVMRLTRCINPQATANRLHWLTAAGVACRDRFRAACGLPRLEASLPTVPWSLYGELLFRHRAAVLLTMNGPMRPAEIRRRAVLRDPDLRMSANNTRDVVRFLAEKEIARPAAVDRNGHARYSLTETGLLCRRLLEKAPPRL